MYLKFIFNIKKDHQEEGITFTPHFDFFWYIIPSEPLHITLQV